MTTRMRDAIFASGALVLAGLVTVAWAGSGYAYEDPPTDWVGVAAPGELSAQAARDLRQRKTRLRSELARVAPHGRYIVVDRTLNKLYLRDAKGVLLDAICSAGSGTVLRDRQGHREWQFSTPQGRFTVLSRLTHPVWKKPDWAFLEEGRPIPANPGDRFVNGELGEYALYFGNGYMIHGTLYERLLGRSVSHGCIRLGRDDLRKLYAATPVGTPVYVY